MTNSEEVDYKLKFAQMTLDTRKNVYDSFIKAIVKYNMADAAYAAIYFDELYWNVLRDPSNGVRASTLLSKSIRHSNSLTELERIEEDITYYDKLIAEAKRRIEGFPDDIKTKIVKDSISSYYLWSSAFAESCKIKNSEVKK